MKRRFIAPWLGAALLLALVTAPGRAAQDSSNLLDPDLKPYQRALEVRGELSSVGSDTLVPLMKAWAERFRAFYPEARISIEGKGSNTAPPALTSGAAKLSPMSRPLKAGEIDEFEKKFGYKPRGIRAAVDAICVIVHKDNPIQSLTLEQLDAIFSKSRLRGKSEVLSWGDLGQGGAWAKEPLRRFGRNSLSGTRLFFQDHALKGGEFREDVQELEGSAALVEHVAADRGAIGYCGSGYLSSGVKCLAVAASPTVPAIQPTAANAYAGEYPLSRILFVYFNQPPRRSPDPLVREFIRMICSKEGQEVVLREGYFPMPAAVAREELAKAD